MPKIKITREGKVVSIPSPMEKRIKVVPVREEQVEAIPPEERIEPPPPDEIEEKPEDELADLFEVPQPEDNDMVTDHLVELDEEDDLSDLTEVTREDIMGTPPVKRVPKRRLKRTGRHYPPPPTSIGGVNY